jgi:uncharacterized membrane protein YidH (DUF202 family)
VSWVKVNRPRRFLAAPRLWERTRAVSREKGTEKQEQYPDADLSREHQANERTLLAWTRTGVGMMGFGVLIARLRFENGAGDLAPGTLRAVDLGVLLAAAGVLTGLLAVWRYYVVWRMLRERRYESWVSGPLLFGSGVVLVGVVILLYLLERLPFR